MAAIDKIYVNTVEQYNLFRDWCSKQPPIKDKYGIEASLLDYIRQYDNLTEDACRCVSCLPYYLDAYLIRNCPLDFIQKELQLNYGYHDQEWINEAYNTVMKRGEEPTNLYSWLTIDDFKIVNGVVTMPNQEPSDYELIKEGKLFSTPSTDKVFKIGKHFKCIKSPIYKYNRPYKRKFWSVSIETSLDFMWYHPDTNTWDFSDEFVNSGWSTSHCNRYKTIKAIKKAILKWKLPVGTVVTCFGRCIQDEYQFIVTA